MPEPVPGPVPEPSPDELGEPTPYQEAMEPAAGQDVEPGADEAAAGGPPPTGRDRLFDAMRRPWSRGQLSAAVLLAVLGFAAVVQVQAEDKDNQYTGAREQDLIALINTLAVATERAEDEIADLERTRNALRNDTEANRVALDLARTQVDTLGILAGTVPTVGPGVRATVSDPRGDVGTEQLLNGVQELRNAGAEAIELNDEVRVVAQTWISTGSSGGIVVDGVQLSPPYKIEAIGDGETLASALDFTGGFIFEVEQVGGSVDVAESDRIEINSVRKLQTPRYAQLVSGE